MCDVISENWITRADNKKTSANLPFSLLSLLSEPTNFNCSTCRRRCDSAWQLVQHAQHAHGIRIYIDPINGLASAAATGAPHPLLTPNGSNSSSSNVTSTPRVAPLRHPPGLMTPTGLPATSTSGFAPLPGLDPHFGLLRMPLDQRGGPVSGGHFPGHAAAAAAVSYTHLTLPTTPYV